jgi:alkylation response protein AidB-like acyl-CoA dehydrogenase
MAGLGWPGALLPEAHGGQGLNHTDLSRILEEMGRGLLPGPYLPTVVAAQAVALAAPPAVQADVLPAVARGERRLALARSAEGGRFDRVGGRFQADADGDGFLLSGEKLSVLGLGEAQQVVVVAALGRPQRAPANLRMFLVDAQAPGVEIAPVQTLEGGWRQARLRLNGVRVPRERHLAGGATDAADALARTEALLELALAFDALGGAQRVLEMTTEYARLRTAFGHPIGTFQAVKHKCADMLYTVENLRAAAIWAAWVLDVSEAESGTTLELATALVRAAAIEAYDVAIRNGTQVHGAIGVTEEHDLQLFAKRAKTMALSFGGLAHYQERILSAHGFAAAGATPPPPG